MASVSIHTDPKRALMPYGHPRSFVVTLLAVTGLALSLQSVVAEAATKANKPNVILIFADDKAAFVGLIARFTRGNTCLSRYFVENQIGYNCGQLR
jgi:hypothetical protein